MRRAGWPARVLIGAAGLCMVPAPAACSTAATTAAPTGACQLVSWGDLPPDLAGNTPAAPHPLLREGSDVCQLDGSTAGQRANQSPVVVGTFTITVAVGQFHTGPAEVPGAVPVAVAGRSGFQVRDQTDTTPPAPRCSVVSPAGSTAVVVVVVNSRFPAHDVCDLAMALAEHIVPRVP